MAVSTNGGIPKMVGLYGKVHEHPTKTDDLEVLHFRKPPYSVTPYHQTTRIAVSAHRSASPAPKSESADIFLHLLHPGLRFPQLGALHTGLGHKE